MEPNKRKKKNDPYLYRILRFDRDVQILDRGELHFSHPSKWDDPFEKAVDNPAMKVAYAQCWCSKGVSDAMWRIYSSDKGGARIKIRKSSLDACIKSAAKDLGGRAILRKVTYKPESQIKEKYKGLVALSKKQKNSTVALSSLFYKRLAYSHEHEYRAVVYDVSGKHGSIDDGLKIKIDAHSLIDSILLDPRAPDEVSQAFEHYLKTVLKYHKRVGKSELYKGVEKIEA